VSEPQSQSQAQAILNLVLRRKIRIRDQVHPGKVQARSWTDLTGNPRLKNKLSRGAEEEHPTGVLGIDIESSQTAASGEGESTPFLLKHEAATAHQGIRRKKTGGILQIFIKSADSWQHRPKGAPAPRNSHNALPHSWTEVQERLHALR
jgi:hypothetical protein